MPRPNIPAAGYPWSRGQIRKFAGLGALYDYLDRFAFKDTVFLFDDFLGDTINLDNYAVANGGGSSAASFAITVAENGWIRATTGTAGDDTSTCSLIGPKIYFGDRNAAIELRFKPVTAVTETRIELGFVDVVPSSNKPVGNNIATPTVNASVADAAIYLYDHTGSTTTNELLTIGSSINAAKTTFTPNVAIAAGTAATVRLQLVGNQAYLYFNGIRVVSHNAAGTDYIEGGNGVAPFALIRASNATSKSLDIDYLAVWQDRA